MPKCKVSGCPVGNPTYTGEKPVKHYFPSEPSVRAEWLRVLGLAEHQVKAHDVVCALHFTDNDYDEMKPDSRGRMPKTAKGKKKKGAIPSRHLNQQVRFRHNHVGN